MSADRLHPLVARQVRRHLGHEPGEAPELRPFLDAVGAAYDQFESDRAMIEHSLELSSKELLQANSEVRAVLQAFPDVVCRLDAEGRILDVHTAAPDDPSVVAAKVGRPLADCIPASVREQFAHAIRMAGGAGTATSFEYPLEGAHGETHHEARVRSLPGGQVLCLIRNMTVRKRIETALRESEARFRTILDSAGPGICGVDADERITFVNAAAAGMIGASPPALVGSRLHDHVTAEDGPFSVRDTIRTGVDGHAHDRRFRRQDGTTFPVDVTVAPIREDGRIVGAVITFTDIQDRLRMEAQLRQAQKLESIGQLAAGVAHEINTPTQFVSDNVRFLSEAFTDLTRVSDAYRSAVDALGRGDGIDEELARVETLTTELDLEFLREEVPQALTQSVEGLDRIARIVGAMKGFTHPGSEEATLVDVNQMIADSVTVSRNEWKYSADLTTELAPDLPLVTGYPAELHQVVLNLIVNAAHAIQEADDGARRGAITVTTRETDAGGVDILIADDGPGVPEELRERIFDPFFTTKGVGKGTGQGLAIAHAIIAEMHGGELALEPSDGRGATFRITLPREGARDGEPSSSDPSGEAAA